MGANDSLEAELAALMRAALAGDNAAYAEFLHAVTVLVRKVVCRKLPECGVIAPEDVVQETLLALHAKRHTWRTSEPILPWLLTIARYKVADVYRRRGTRVFVDIEDVAGILAAPEVAVPLDKERQIEGAISGLSDGQQKVVRSVAIDGRSIKETAHNLGMKETAVRVAFHRGLTTIAARFGRMT